MEYSSIDGSVEVFTAQLSIGLNNHFDFDRCNLKLVVRTRPQSANDLKIFAISESPVKIRKIAVDRFFISLLVLELSRFKNLKTIKNSTSDCAVLGKINQT